jgi:hypothetical protein
MKIVLEQEDIEGLDKVFSIFEKNAGDFNKEFAEWWANNHSGEETVDLLKAIISEYESGGQHRLDKQRVREYVAAGFQLKRRSGLIEHDPTYG